MLEMRLYQTAAGRSQPADFLGSLPAKDRALVAGDIESLRQYGLSAPVSLKPIKGKNNRGMWEIRTGRYRTFFCRRASVIWILHICKKDDQVQGIEAARPRMEAL